MAHTAHTASIAITANIAPTARFLLLFLFVSLYFVVSSWRRPRITHLMHVTWVGWLPTGIVVGAVVEITRRRVFAKPVTSQTELCFVKQNGHAMRCAETQATVPYWLEHQIDHNTHTRNIHTVPENIAVSRLHDAAERGRL